MIGGSNKFDILILFRNIIVLYLQPLKKTYFLDVDMLFFYLTFLTLSFAPTYLRYIESDNLLL